MRKRITESKKIMKVRALKTLLEEKAYLHLLENGECSLDEYVNKLCAMHGAISKLRLVK